MFLKVIELIVLLITSFCVTLVIKPAYPLLGLIKSGDAHISHWIKVCTLLHYHPVVPQQLLSVENQNS